jgi:hypothetical protein
MDEAEALREKYEALAPLLNERTRRCWAGAEARALGYGGVSVVSRATGLNRATVLAGLKELPKLTEQDEAAVRRQRHPGGGRKPVQWHDPALLTALDRLIDPVTRGAPNSPLRWTCKGTARLATELTREGHPVRARTVAALLKAEGYSLQAPTKAHEGGSLKDRNAQFEYIAAKVASFQEEGWPVISVDGKKKELVGNFRGSGREWQPSGQPVKVNVYDFERLAAGKATPYGVYDLEANLGWVSVGRSHDTPRFAVQAVREWWLRMGSRRYHGADHLLITADGGGSNSARSRVWKAQLQALADETGLHIAVCHFPPGTSKWNKTENWRGRPLTTFETVVQLIAHTTTQTGLRVEAALDKHEYPLGERVSKPDFEALNLTRDDFHGEWNYGEWNYWINPKQPTS